MVIIINHISPTITIAHLQ